MRKEKLTKYMVNHFSNIYPEYTKKSVESTLKKIIEKNNEVDAITIHHYLVPARFGGLGMGKSKKKLKKVM
jgi:molybdopterin synthase catalytic subunit